MSTPNKDAIRATISFEPDLHQALRLKSAHSGRSMSDIVNHVLRQALCEDEADLSAVCARAKERSLGYEGFVAKLKAAGTL